MNINSAHFTVLSMSRSFKRAILLAIDLIMLPLALWSAYSLRLSEWFPSDYLSPASSLFIAMPIIGVASFVRLGLYRAVTRYLTSEAMFVVLKGVLVTSFSLYVLQWLFNVEPFPRSVPVIFALVAAAYVGGTRMFIRGYYQWLLGRYIERKPIAIYGAGAVGAQLAQSMSSSGEFVPVVFLDDDPKLTGSTVAGVKVDAAKNLEFLITKFDIKAVLIALPNISDQRRAEILAYVSKFPLQVKVVPSVEELLAGANIKEIRDVQLEDLLGRELVPPKSDLLEKNVRNKKVLVTGAGGSIGSEICRQVIGQRAAQLILIDNSEFALYTIESELSLLKELTPACDTEIIPVLGSITDQALMNKVMSDFAIQTVYHAAAFKHVPLVEQNILQGFTNNAFGTRVVAQAASDAGVERFVMISTDKAVRPTNVMGASKRFAEIIIQSLAAQSNKTIFCMVRFGNVLGSSGSVIPLFKRQINQGGPVTVTDPQVTRYFMMIPEAASLVIQAGALAKGGDVFLLDMGESIKIEQLARTLIRLSGKRPFVRGEEVGDIEIRYTGLRPGEKLYEELLIGDDVSSTDHPKIWRAHEELLQKEQLEVFIFEAEKALEKNDAQGVREVLAKAVSGYKPSIEYVDWSTSFRMNQG